MLIVKHLSFKYSGQSAYALNDLSFSCESEGITTIVGKSGVGKSTLIALISGILLSEDPVVGFQDGEILLDGKVPHQLRGASVLSWVPQEPVLLDHLTVIENVLLPLTVAKSGDNRKDFGYSLLAKLGIEQYARSRPRGLSGGMRTRVSLARALASQPQYLFLDEPFGGVDLMNRWNIFRVLLSERRQRGFKTFITSHDLPESVILSSRLVILRLASTGHVAEMNSCNEFAVSLDDPAACLRRAREIAAPIEAKMLGDV